jgi:hypothetical protein
MSDNSQSISAIGVFENHSCAKDPNTGQCCSLAGSCISRQSSFFRSKPDLWRVKADPQIGTLVEDGQRAEAFTAALILVIALPEEKDNSDLG